MHASWNLIARYGRSESTFYAKMLITMMVVGFIPAVWSELVTRSLVLTAWLCVVGSGFSAGLYLFFLARAFESSDFTVVYPVARSLPVIFVAMGDVLRGRCLTPMGWLGILLVAGGPALYLLPPAWCSLPGGEDEKVCAQYLARTLAPTLAAQVMIRWALSR
jgi:uncharacterized membrane protein